MDDDERRADPPGATGTRKPRWFYGWTVVGVVGILSFAGGVETNPVLGVFQGPVTDEFGWSRAIFTLPMAIGTFAGGVASVVTGPLMDRFGGRWVMSVAALLMGAIFVLMGIMEAYWQYFGLQLVGRTVVASAFFMVIGVVIPKWFVLKRGRAIGAAGLGQRLGHVAFPIIIERVLAIGSWRTAAVTLGVIVWVTSLLPTLLFLRRRPEDHGLRPDGLPDIRQQPLESQSDVTTTRRPEETSLTRSQAIRTPAFYLLIAALSLQSFVATGLNFHWFSYLTDNGLSGGVAVTSLSLAPLIAMPVSILTGFVVEKLPSQLVQAGAYGLMAISLTMFLFTDNAWLAYFVGVMYGVATGTMVTINQIIWADFFGRTSIGAIRGMTSPVHMTTNALGPLVAAASFDITGGYTLIFTIGVGVLIAAGVLVGVARKPQPPR